jgi:hypothetical protein
MSNPLRLITDEQMAALEQALRDARSARANLRRGGAPRAAAYMSAAIKSAEGALRHAYRRRYEALRQQAQRMGRAVRA